jgi:hypothetical protein
LRLAQDKNEEDAKQHQRHNRDQQVAPGVPKLRRGDSDIHIGNLLGGHAQVAQRVDRTLASLEARLQHLSAHLADDEFVAVHLDRAHVAAAHECTDIGDGHVGGSRRWTPRQRCIEKRTQGDDQQEIDDTATKLLGVHAKPYACEQWSFACSRGQVQARPRIYDQ